MLQENIIKPIYNDNFVVIAMSSSEEYLPYVCVYLQSIIDASSCNCKYDIVIFSNSNNENKKKIIKDTYSKNNISVRFFNPHSFFKGLNLEITHDYFNEACYYRIVAPLIFQSYEKVIFTDIDLIALTDLKELYEVNIYNSPLMACKEPIWEYFIDNNICFRDLSFRKYSKDILQLKDIKKYYNTGIILFNVKKFLEGNYFNKLLNLIEQNHFIYQEQCALNCLLNDKILPLNKEWNYEILDIIQYEDDIKPKILHFLGENKPWHYKNLDFAGIWWEYAQRTPFYNEINDRYLRFKEKEVQVITNKIKLYQFKIFKYNILSSISFGEKKKYYSKKLKINKKELEKLNLLKEQM